MTERDEALSFQVDGDQLFGVLSSPPSATHSGVGVVVVVGGPQYRIGSHRQFVLLARHLAVQGHAVLRFDARGMGDSEGAPRDFLALDDDIAGAIAALRSHLPSVRRIVLWGLCDGASAALLYAGQHPGAVHGLALLNPWVRTESVQAQVQVRHYYARRLVQRDFWVKLAGGKLGRGAVGGLWRALSAAAGRKKRPAADESDATYPVRMARAWHAFDGPMLLLLSGRDFTAKEFLLQVAGDPAWRGALQRPDLVRHDLPDADHTFSTGDSPDALRQACASWLARRFRPSRPGSELTAGVRATACHGASP